MVILHNPGVNPSFTSAWKGVLGNLNKYHKTIVFQNYSDKFIEDYSNRVNKIIARTLQNYLEEFHPHSDNGYFLKRAAHETR